MINIGHETELVVRASSRPLPRKLVFLRSRKPHSSRRLQASQFRILCSRCGLVGQSPCVESHYPVCFRHASGSLRLPLSEGAPSAEQSRPTPCRRRSPMRARGADRARRQGDRAEDVLGNHRFHVHGSWVRSACDQSAWPTNVARCLMEDPETHRVYIAAVASTCAGARASFSRFGPSASHPRRCSSQQLGRAPRARASLRRPARARRLRRGPALCRPR